LPRFRCRCRDRVCSVAGVLVEVIGWKAIDARVGYQLAQDGACGLVSVCKDDELDPVRRLRLRRSGPVHEMR